MPRPFLSIVTRCYKRPLMLAMNKQSIAAQTCQDFEQLFLVDDEGRGVHAANQALATAQPRGDYVMILDDDDMLATETAIETMKEATVDNPDIVVFRADHGKLGVLPSPAVYWHEEPISGRIGSCDFIVRRRLWKRHIAAFGTPACGDYHFLKSLWATNPTVVWIRDVLAAVQRISRGAPEEAVPA